MNGIGGNLFDMGKVAKKPVLPWETPRKTRIQPQFSAEDIYKIYQAYPRKIKPRPAFKAIEEALGRIDDPDPVGALLAIVKEYADSPAGNNGCFTPHPASWFNAGSYLDDPEEWQKVGK